MLSSGLKRWAMRLSYDGQPFVGWQWQPRGESVQRRLEESLWLLTRERVRVHGSGRTDSGTHAHNQVAHVDLRTSLSAERLLKGLNGLGKSQLVVKQLMIADPAFHARYSANGKHYRYCIHNRPWPPTLKKSCWWIQPPLDWEAMRKAATSLLGRHDFAAFRSIKCTSPSTHKTMSAVDIIDKVDLAEEGIYWIEMRASGFLQHMARIICGSLVEIGLGKQPPEQLSEALASGRRDLGGSTAPARGLHLLAVCYPKEVDPFVVRHLA